MHCISRSRITVVLKALKVQWWASVGLHFKAILLIGKSLLFSLFFLFWLGTMNEKMIRTCIVQVGKGHLITKFVQPLIVNRTTIIGQSMTVLVCVDTRHSGLVIFSSTIITRYAVANVPK